VVSSSRHIIGLASLLAGTAVVGLDSAVNIDFPRIAARFALAIPQIQWVVVSYTLTSASLLLVFGRIGDLIGHRRLFRIGAGWSVLAFIACAAAPDFAWLLFGRVAQGVGAGLLLSCGPALATQLYPEARRARALAIYTAGFAGAGALGPVLGGLLLARFDWSSVFWFRAPIALFALLAAAAIPAPPRAEPARAAFDGPGALWLVAGLASLVLAIGTAQTAHSLAALPAAGALGAAALFVRAERRATAPIIRPGLFRDPGFALLTAASVLMNLAGFAVLLLVPFALAGFSALPESARGAALALSPAAVALGAPLASRAVGRGRAWPLRAGAALAASGLALCALSPGALGRLLGGMLLAGIGQGLFQVAYLDRTAAALPVAERGVAGSLAMLTRTFGLVLGATVLMLVFRFVRGADTAPAAFRGAFVAAFLFAAALPASVALVWCARPPGGRA